MSSGVKKKKERITFHSFALFIKKKQKKKKKDCPAELAFRTSLASNAMARKSHLFIFRN